MSNLALTELLASYVPRLIQNRVIADPSPIESPAAEDFQAALLFADISGFTLLTERLMEMGPSGVETLARILNEYFGLLIDIIHDYGGDVVKFAGDAVIAVWPVVPDLSVDVTPPGGSPSAKGAVSRADQWQWTMRAAECAIEVHRRLTNYKVENANLYLKLAISMGRINTAHVGGVFNRWEFLITGTPLVELGIANSIAQAGQILITPSAWKLIRNDCRADPIEFELRDTIAQGGRLDSLNKPSSIFSAPKKLMIPEGAENSLRPYIPGAIINRLTAGQNSWIAELRRVTVLFINLPDLDQHTKLEHAQNIARLIQKSVYRYEGSINKINVDDKGITIVAAMGLPPFAHEDDPARAVQAALMIRRELAGLNIRSHIGITTGRIFCGSVGNESRREYTIIGNAVNLSARLMGAASHQDELVARYGVPILCDRLTYDSAKDAVEFEPFAPQLVKGRREPVEAFHPLEQKKSVIRPKTELIGRQEEKTWMANALQELSRGTPHQTLVLLGEAGIGKSRLFEDLLRQAETLRVKTYAGSGDPIEKSNPYHAWRPIFNKILGLDELLSKVEFKEEAQAAVQTSIVDKLEQIDPDLARYAPLIDVVLPTPIPDNEFTASLTGEIRSSNVREVLTRLLAFETSQTPLLIALEDLHWFDSASWTLLMDVQQKVRPLFLAINTRPLTDPVPAQFKELLETPGTQLVRLEAMPLDDVEALVCQRLGVKSVPPMIGRLIREKSEGHPFFAEELAYALRDSGVLVIENQECSLYSRFANFEDLALPDTLQAAITNRIDSLQASQQLTLKVASVIGRIFAFRVLEAIHPIEADRAALSDCMQSLTRLSLTMIESESPDLAYIFKHAVTQEVAYNLMLFSQRRQLHQAVAEWIEKNHAKNLESYYILLAHHWSQAAETSESQRNEVALQKALEYLEKAGEQAMQNFANKEAIQFFTQALDLDEKLSGPEAGRVAQDRKVRRARWHSRVGLAHYGLGSLPDCERQVREALHLLGYPLPRTQAQFAFGLVPQIFRQVFHRYFPSRFIGSLKPEERDHAREVSRLFELIGRFYFYSQEQIPVVYSILRFVNIAERAGASSELASSYSAMAVLAGFVQLHSLADIYVKRALAIAEEVNQPSNLITVQVVTSVYQISVGKWDEIRIRAEKAKLLCEQIGDYRQWGDSMDVLGESALISGDLSYAAAILHRLLEDARQRRNPLQVCWGLFGVGAINIRQGNDAAAIPMLEEALEILAELPNLASSISTYAQLALAYLHLDQDQTAVHYADKVLGLAANISPTVYSLDIGFSAISQVYFTLWEKARLGPASARADQHKSSAEQALKLLRGFQKVFPIGQAYMYYYQAWYEELTGKPEQALRTLRLGLEASQKYRLLFEEALIRVKLGSYLHHDPRECEEHFGRAIQIFEEMGAVHKLQAARRIQAGEMAF